MCVRVEACVNLCWSGSLYCVLSVSAVLCPERVHVVQLSEPATHQHTNTHSTPATHTHTHSHAGHSDCYVNNKNTDMHVN